MRAADYIKSASERKKKDREKNEISVVYGIADLFYR